jgi:cobalamin-dependent methionine synthase I
MSDKGMPKTVSDRLTIAEELINGLVKNNIPMGNIYVDPLVHPISTNDEFGVKFLDAAEQIMTQFEGVHTICGLSNISYGLPERRLLNRVFAVMAIAKGLDSLIINPLDKRMMRYIVAAESLAGKDSFCENYLKACRDRRLEIESFTQQIFFLRKFTL